MEQINRMRNGNTIDTLTSVDIVEIVITSGDNLHVYEGFFCCNLDLNPYIDFVHDMIAKRYLYKKQGKNLLKSLAKNIPNSAQGDIFRKAKCEQYKSVPENCIEGNLDDKIKECWPSKNGNLIVEMQDDEGVDEQQRVKLSNTKPFRLKNCVLGHSKQIRNI